jgi:hypothetical protein
MAHLHRLKVGTRVSVPTDRVVPASLRRRSDAPGVFAGLCRCSASVSFIHLPRCQEKSRSSDKEEDEKGEPFSRSFSPVGWCHAIALPHLRRCWWGVTNAVSSCTYFGENTWQGGGDVYS